MEIWQFFIVLRHPVTILVTVFPNPTKLTKDLFILTSGIPSVNRINLQVSTLVGPTITKPVLNPLAVLNLDN